MVSSKSEGKRFQRNQTVKMIIKGGTIPKNYNLYNNNYFCFYYLYLSLAGNIIVYTPNQGTNREIGKSTLFLLFIKGKMPTLAGNKQLSIQFFLHGPRLFNLSTEKRTGSIRRKGTSKWLFPRRHNKQKHKQKNKDISIQGKNTRTQ